MGSDLGFESLCVLVSFVVVVSDYWALDDAKEELAVVDGAQLRHVVSDFT